MMSFWESVYKLITPGPVIFIVIILTLSWLLVSYADGRFDRKGKKK